MRSLLLLLLACLPGLASAAFPWPELAALEGLSQGRVLACEPALGRLVLLRLACDSLAAMPEVVAGGGLTARPVAADGRLGLQILVLDAAGVLHQLNRDLLHQGRLERHEAVVPARPDLLGVSAGRSLVLADARAGTVVVRRPGERWTRLLDATANGIGPLRQLAVAGERVFLLGGGRLWLCGVEGGWWAEHADSTVAAIHRGAEEDLWLLRRLPDQLVLEQWPDAGGLDGLPDPAAKRVACYPRPAAPPRDFLVLPSPSPREAPRLLVSLAGEPAQVLSPLPEAP